MPLTLQVPRRAAAQWPYQAKLPDSDVAEAARDLLDEKTELGQINSSLAELSGLLSSKLEDFPVFIDERAVKIAEISPNDNVSADLPLMPLRSALRTLLAPHGLKAVIENEGFVITADFSILTRRGIATDRWVDIDVEFSKRAEKIFDTPVSIECVEVPLSDAMRILDEDAKLPIRIDARALEEIGLSADQPVTISVNDLPLRSVLQLILRNLDLTYVTQNDVVMVTTIQAAEQNLQNRIYWLEGTGFPTGDFQSIIDLIQTSIVPDTWEALGGPSTIAPVTLGTGNRPAILVSTIYSIHHKIENLLSSLRDTHVGPDPQVVSKE